MSEKKPWAWLEQIENESKERARIHDNFQDAAIVIYGLTQALHFAKETLEKYACLAEKEEPLGLVKGYFAREALDKLAKGEFE